LFFYLKIKNFKKKFSNLREKKQDKWYSKQINSSARINQDDISNFVNCLKDITFTAIFSKTNDSFAQKTFQYLTFLKRDIMIPPLMEKLSKSFDSLIDPHRYTAMLSCLVLIARELPRFESNSLIQTQIHIIPLLCAVLPGIDSNDSQKCNLTFKLLSNILSCVIVCNCSNAPSHRNDLTEAEIELCFETSKFEDFVHDFFNKIFRLLDNLAFDTTSDSLGYSAVNEIINTNTDDENAYLTNMMYTIRVLIRQSSRPILKLILNKFKNYISGNNYNVKSGKVVASMCGCLASSTQGYARTCFVTLFDLVYENLRRIKETKSYEVFLTNERGDIEIQWNLELLSGLMKANGLIIADHIDRVTQLIRWYKSSVNLNSIDYVSSCFVNVLTSLTNISSIEYCSVSYNIVYEENEEMIFFKNHLPIRDWGCNPEKSNLNLKYHIPSLKEIEVSLEFVDIFLKDSIQFLTESVLLSKNEESLTTSSKEERNRELKYIYHIIYGASSLLKRPSNSKIFMEHIKSNVEIGIKDSLDKGLGFEAANLNDESHEYFSLTENYRNILLHTRENLIEFTIKLADKLNTNYPNETTLIMLASRILSTSSITYGCRTWNDYLDVWRNHTSNKLSLQNELLGKHYNTRVELIQNSMLQYQYRSFHIHTQLNELDLRIINTLFKLSTDSLYVIVRLDAQNQLFTLMSQYPYSNLTIVSTIVQMLNRCSFNQEKAKALAHNQLKGCLYILENSLITEQNWDVISEIWPALLQCQDFDRSSTQLMLYNIYNKGYMGLNSFDNRVKLSENVLSLIYEHSDELNLKYSKNEGLRLQKYAERVIKENSLIENCMSKLVKIASESQLVWTNQFYRYAAFLFLLNSCKLEKRLLTSDCVHLFVDSLVNENISVRSIGIDVMCILFKMIKFKKQVNSYDILKLIKEKSGENLQDSISQICPGYRSDNKWHLYNPNFINPNEKDSNTDQQTWNDAKFLDKSYWGYYSWPTSKIDIPSNLRSNLNSETCEYSAAIKYVKDKFQFDGEFVKKFIKLSTIEESKGNEKFDIKKFYFFKSLFRNFGNTDIFNNLYENLRLLICDKHSQTHESSHKLASELLSGLIRGSKYWSLSDLKVLWSNLKPILDLIFENISTENIDLWYSCFSNAYVCFFN
jgi:proteasome activator subunit 4